MFVTPNCNRGVKANLFQGAKFYTYHPICLFLDRSGLLVTKRLEFDFCSKNTRLFATKILNGFNFNQFFNF